MNRTTTLQVTLAIIVSYALTLTAFAQGRFDDVQIKTVKVSDNIYMLVGSGGNIGLSIGEDGAFMIDDQFAPLTEKILAAVAKLTDQPVRFLVNTHWHGDHVGGNENMGKAGAIIVAHENVRQRLHQASKSSAADSEAGLPVVTFDETVTFHWNGNDIHVFHVDTAHTDGDSIIHFRNANVLHMGDTYFNGVYPYIDLSSNGSIDGLIAAANQALSIANETTKIIPGHGQLSDRAALQAYRDMLTMARYRVQTLIDQGESRKEVIAAKPTEDMDEHWGSSRFVPPDRFVGILYDSLTKN